MNKFKVSLLFIFIILLVFVLLVGGIMPYYLFYIFIFIILFPFIHSIISIKKLQGSINIPTGSLYPGDMIEISYNIKNNSYFPIAYLQIENHIAKELTGVDSTMIISSLNSKDSFYHRENIILKRRGYYEIGEIHITLRDIFGFFSLQKTIINNTSLLVYPRIINLSAFEISKGQSSGDSMVHHSLFQDISKIASLREYRYGDSIKSIHWKLSAKSEDIVVKEYELPGSANIIIFLDNYKELFYKDINRHLEDLSVDIALSIIDYSLREDMPVILQTQDKEGYLELQGNQNAQLKEFLRFLAEFKANGPFDSKSLLLPRIHTYPKGSTIIIITPNLDKSMGINILQLKMANLNPMVFLIMDSHNNLGYIDIAVERNLIEDGIPVYLLDHNSSIKDILEAHNG